MDRLDKAKVALVSRCAWTLYNFRAGLIRALREKGVMVIGGGAGGDGFEGRIRDLGVPFFVLPVDKRGINPAADLRLMLHLYRWYRVQRPAIAHHFTIKPVIYGSFAAKAARVPVVINTVTGLGYVFTDQSRALLGNLVKTLYHIAFRLSDHIFFQNNEDKEFFFGTDSTPFGKVTVLPGSGVDCTTFVPAQTPEKSKGKNITFLMVSRVLRDKGLYEFVEAGRLVKKVYPAKFKLLGRRDERNPSVVRMEELEQWQSEGVLEWLGEAEDVRPILAEADVVVLPSYREGTPRALLEASAMAKPVIATEVPGCREVVANGQTGFLVPPRDAGPLAGAMLKMIENSEMRRRMGKEGRSKVEREFDERIVIGKTLEIYSKLLENGYNCANVRER